MEWIFGWLSYFIFGRKNVDKERLALDDCTNLVELDKELRAVHKRRSNSHVLKKIDEYVYNECVPKLPLKAFNFIDDRLAVERHAIC